MSGVTILPPERTGWDVLSKHLGQGFQNALPQMYENQKREMNKRALEHAFGQLNPQVSPMDQLRSLMPLMSVPGGAQAIQQFQKSQEEAARNKQLMDIFGGNAPNQLSPGNVPNQPGGAGEQQNGPDFSKITDDQLARLAVADPQRANALRQIVYAQRQQKADKQKFEQESLSNDKFSEGYKAIQDDDTKSFNAIMRDPKTPYEVKNKLSNLKNQHDVRKDVKNREVRTRQHYLKGAYSKAINNEKDRLKTARAKDKPEIEENIKELIRLQRKDMKKFTEDPESYPQLSIWNSEASRYLPEEEPEERSFDDMMDDEDQENADHMQPRQGQEVTFNPKDPEHRARANELFSKLKDKEKVRQILSKEFEGL